MGSLKEDAIRVGRAKRATLSIVEGYAWWEARGMLDELLEALNTAGDEGRVLTDDEYMALLTPAEPTSDESDES